MNRTVALVAALLIVPVLAGCTGQTADPAGAPGPESPGSPNGTVPTTSSGNGSSTARFDVDPAHETIWANGSVAVQETNAGRGQVSESEFRVVSLDDVVPAGVPVRVNASARWNATQVGPVSVFDNVDLQLRAATTAVYDREGNDNEVVGSEYLAATLGRGSDQSVAIAAEGQWPSSADGISYTLRIDVDVDPARLPSGSLVAAETVAGSPLTVAPPNGSNVRAFAWGPDDAYLSSVNSSRPRPLPGTESLGGEVVVLLPDGGSLRSAAGPLDLLGQKIVEGEARAVPPAGQPVEWSFETETPPLAVGLVAEAADPGTARTGTVEAQVRTDNGTVVELTDGCGFCLQPPGPFGAAWSDPGAGGDATSFTGTAQADATLNAQVRHLVLTYDR